MTIILLIFALLMLNGAFAMAEIALVSVKKSRLQQAAEAGNKRARIALKLIENPERILSTVQIGITAIGVIAGAYGATSLSDDLTPWVAGLHPSVEPHASAIAFGIVIVFTTFLSLILGELIPKRIALAAPEPMAAAIGVGLPIEEPAANMIVDIGGGTTEIAVISLNGIVFSKSIRVAGDELDSAIIDYMKRAYNLLIGERTAEEIKCRVGSAYPLDEELTMEVKGRDSVAGLPKTIHITSQEIREALADTISHIVDAVRVTLERCPPELSADLVDRGLVLAGGGALLRGLDRLLSEATGLPVHVAEDPLSAVAEGTGRALSEIKFLRAVSAERPHGR